MHCCGKKDMARSANQSPADACLEHLPGIPLREIYIFGVIPYSHHVLASSLQAPMQGGVQSNRPTMPASVLAACPQNIMHCEALMHAGMRKGAKAQWCHICSMRLWLLPWSARWSLSCWTATFWTAWPVRLRPLLV